MTRPNIDAEQFAQVSAHCGRWNPKSLDIARALIVEGRQLSDVAAEHDCSAAYANVIRSRFYDKAQSVRLASFKQQINPDTLASLQPYRNDIEALNAEGYTVAQLVDYLAQNNVSVSADTVRKFLKGGKR